MLCALDSEITKGHTLLVDTTEWMGKRSFSVKSSVFVDKITHFRRDFAIVRSRGG